MSALHDPNPGHPELKWCHSCGDWVLQLFDDDLCILCLEIDARMDAHIGAAMEDYAEQAISVALDYLHVDDVNAVIARLLDDPHRNNDSIRRLRDRYELSHEFINRRSRETRERAESPLEGERSSGTADNDEPQTGDTAA